METGIENNNDFQPTLFIDQQSVSFLEETRKWAHFLSILGFIGIGLMLLAGLFFGSFMSSFSNALPTAFPMGFFSFLYLIVAAFYFFPVLYLYRFSVDMKAALHQNNQQKLTGSFANMKSLFRFMGVLTIVVLSLYLVIIVTAVIVGIMR